MARRHGTLLGWGATAAPLLRAGNPAAGGAVFFLSDEPLDLAQTAIDFVTD